MAETTVNLHESNGESLVATCIALLVVSWIAVCLRSYTRIVLMKSYEVDDILMLIAQIIFTVTCFIQFEGVKSGVGRHNAAITNEDDRVAAIMWQALGVANYILNMMFVKLSIGVFLLRLAAKKLYIWIIRIALVTITIWSLGLFIWDIFQCTPIQKQWDYRITTGTCASVDEILTVAYALSVMTVLTDWFFALIPIFMLWGVKMTTQAKVTVFMILSLGIFASIATLIRLKFLTEIQLTDDILFRPTNASIWSLVEVGVAITASSLATVRPLLRSLNIRGFISLEKSRGSDVSGPERRRSRSHKVPDDSMLPTIDPYGMCLQDVTGGGDGHDGVAQTNNKRDGLAIGDYHTSIKGIEQGSASSSDDKSEVYVMTGETTPPTSGIQNLRPIARFMDHSPYAESQRSKFQRR
ncbi:hypothetical protein E4U43_002605 [Claviceps pusilla]|uniref:Rhodopsin domain-containing protein n=1 Tax=Claviceps pusilla TaxID=123648 RepID=A0A9P7N8I2_9HYPO|nr:hypothetical protein E4U43_002605 [Claviceps pusilla]